MARYGFSTAEKKKTFEQLPKLKFTAKDEKQRITILNENYEMLYGHYISQGSGDTKTGNYYRCLGDESVIDEFRIDPDNCRACKECDLSDKESPVGVSKPRFLFEVGLYPTKSDGTPINGPVRLDYKVWILSSGTFNKLLDLQNEWADHGGIIGRDLVLTCTNSQYKNLDITVQPTTAWQKDKDFGQAAFDDAKAQCKDSDALKVALARPMTDEKYERLFHIRQQVTENEIGEEIDETLKEFREDGFSTMDDANSEGPVSFRQMFDERPSRTKRVEA